MQVRKSTFEKDLAEKEKAFLALSGAERIRMMRIVSDRLRKNVGDRPQLTNLKVRITKIK